MPFIHRKEKRKSDSATPVNHAFFGRVPEIAFFKEDILAPETPAYNIISISGIAGVGKTTFLAKIKEEVSSAQFERYCKFALVDEKVTNPLNIMEHFARQLQITGDFEKELEQCKEAFLRVHQEQNEFREAVIRETGTVVGSALKLLPVPGTPLLGEATSGVTQLVGKQLYLHQQRQDAKRLEHALSNVTQAFLKELKTIVWDQCSVEKGKPKRNQRLLLCFDTFEKLASEVAPWLLNMISAEDIEGDIVFVVAGRDPLDSYPQSRTKEWLPYVENEIFHKIRLGPYTEEETYQYLAQRGFQNEADMKKVWKLSRGLPLYLGLLIAHSEGNIDPRHSVIENFLLGIPEDESSKRRLAIEAALFSKPFNQDDLEAFPYIDREKYSEMYQWLMTQPLIRHNRDDGTCSYHELIQDLFCEHLHHTAPSEYSAARRALVAHYQRQLKQWDINETPDDIWCETVFALVQQHIALDTKEDQAEIIEWSVLASQKAGKKSMLGTFFKRYEAAPRMSLSSSMKNLLSLLSYYLVEKDVLEETEMPTFSFFMEGTEQVRIPVPLGEHPPFFSEAIKVNPKIIGLDSGYYLVHTMTLVVMRRHEEALNTCANFIAVNPTNAQSYLLRALVYRAMQEYDKALDDCNKAIALSPQEAQFYFLRAHVYRAMQDDQKALTNYTTAIELAPQEAQLYFARAQVYESLQEHETALTDCDRAIELAPQEAQLYPLRAQIYLAMQKYEQALADCDTAIELPHQARDQVRDTQPTKGAQKFARTLVDKITPSTQFTKLVQELTGVLIEEREEPDSQPDNHTHELIRTLIAERIQELASGLKDLLESSDAQPDDTGWQQVKELKDLLESFDIQSDEIGQQQVRELKNLLEAPNIQLNEAGPRVRIQIDELVQKLVSKRIDEYDSKTRFDKFEKTMMEKFGPPNIEHGPSDQERYGTAQAYFVRAQTYEAMQEHENALADYTRASKLVPREAWPYYYRGKIYQAMTELEKAMADYTKAIELESQEAQLYIARAHIFQEKDDSEKALADYTKAIELEPTNMQGCLGRAYLYFDMEEFEKALADCNQFIERMPTTSTLPYLSRGAFYWHMKEYDKALTDFTKAIELEPTNAYAYFTRSQMYQEMGEQEKAQTDIAKATQLDPSIVERYSLDEDDDRENPEELPT
jgi:tetratricopeptide (TPR) repeat protein